MSKKKVAQFFLTLQRVLIGVSFTGMGLLLLGYGVKFLVLENLGSAFSCFGAGVAMLFAALIDRFESLKAFGVEAKTRDLRRIIDEAQVTIEQFGEVTRTLCTPIARLYCGPGTHDSDPTLAEKAQIALEIKSAMESVGRSTNEIRSVLEPWVLGAARDAHRLLSEAANQEVVNSLNEIHAKRAEIEDKNAMEEKASEIHAWQRRPDRHPALSSVEQIIEHAGQFVGAPVLHAEQRERISREVARTVEEIKHLNGHLKYNDRQFWEKVSEHYGTR